MDNIRFFNPGLGFKSIKTEVMSEIERVLDKGDLILRDDVEKFEKTLAEYVGTKYAVALNSGTDALYLACKAIGKKFDRVSVPSHTFVATAQVVEQAGMKIDLYDLGELPKLTKPVIGSSNRIIMVAHIAGELSPIPDTDFPVIEDACQALGAVKNPTSDAQCWSFYPAKILGCYGDGGALTTNRKDVYDYVKEARNHFKTDYKEWGINSRLDNLQAAILNVKFKYLPDILAKRKAVADYYLANLKGVGLPNNTKGRVWQDFVINCSRDLKREQLYFYLQDNGIEVMRNDYPMPCGKLPKAEKYEAETLRIPCNENLTNAEIEEIVKRINKFYV